MREESKIKKIDKIIAFGLATLLLGLSLASPVQAVASIFNYQGKLLTPSGVAVTDGFYDVTLKIYDVGGGGTALYTENWTSANLFSDNGTTVTNDGCAAGVDKIVYTSNVNEATLKPQQTLWNGTTFKSAIIQSVDTATNTLCVYDPLVTWASGNAVTNRIYVKNGLFSTLVGSVTPQTLTFDSENYFLGVTVGTDSEMVPRKRIGSVPHAISAANLVGSGNINLVNTNSAKDAASIAYNPASGSFSTLNLSHGITGTGNVLTLTQNGTGNIMELKNSTTSVFTVQSSGNATLNANSFTQTATNPVAKGFITDGAGTALDGPISVAVAGKYAYVASFRDNGLQIIDVSNPAAPTAVGQIVDNGTNTALAGAYAVYVSGKYAYVASRTDNGLQIIDVSNPTAPTAVGQIVDAGTNTALAGATSVYVSGRYAYVASVTDKGLQIIDVSNPAAPTAVGQIVDNGTLTALASASSLYVQGKYAYVVSYLDNGLQIIDSFQSRRACCCRTNC